MLRTSSWATATPIQLDAVELWDLLSALNQGAPQVLGTVGGDWTREDSIQFLTVQRPWPQNDTNRWDLFRNPLPPASENAVFRDIRNDAALDSKDVLGPRYDDLGADVRGDSFKSSTPSPNGTTRSCVASFGGRARCSKSAAFSGREITICDNLKIRRLSSFALQSKRLKSAIGGLLANDNKSVARGGTQLAIRHTPRANSA